jgi:choline dehydrogenase-like flavoprotein
MWTALAVIMNAQSRGRVSLQSKRPEDPPAIDLNFLSSPYDVSVVIEAVRAAAGLLQQSVVLETQGPLAPGPRTLDDDDIFEYVRQSLGHLWHAAGTVKMGKAGAEGTCVTPDFRVVGVEGLMVADLSILPILPSNHTQSTAYLVGETAAEKIIAEIQSASSA